jgi:hypothetical protein
MRLNGLRFIAFVTVSFQIVRGVAQQPEPLSNEALNAAAAALDRAIRAAGEPRSDAQELVRSTMEALPRDPGVRATGELGTFLTRMPTPGPGFRCDPEFLRHRTRLELLQVREALANQSAPKLEPQFCSATPNLVDLSKPASERRAVEIYGADFDRAEMQMFVVSRGNYQDVTSALRARTPYHFTLNLQEIDLPPDAELLGLSWGNLIQAVIPLVHPNTQLCAARVDEVPRGRTIEYAPSRIAPASLSGPDQQASGSAGLDFASNELDAVVCMTACDDARHIALSGCAAGFLATIDSDRTIEAVLGTTYQAATFTRRRQPGRERATRGGPVDEWTLGAQTTVRFDPIRLVSIPRDGCVSPFAYLEAKRHNIVTADTVRRLAPQLARTPVNLLEIRPPFTPR